MLFHPKILTLDKKVSKDEDLGISILRIPKETKCEQKEQEKQGEFDVLEISEHNILRESHYKVTIASQENIVGCLVL